LRIRVLLDECIPVEVADELPKHDVQTIRGMRWRGKKNGEPLQLAAANFNVFVTIDQGLVFQQRIATLKLGVVTHQ
jgi:predicted nuclease of predicted toxin-antitoxin system